MKRIVFDKIVSLVIDTEEQETTVVVNGVKLYYDGKILTEKGSDLTVEIAKEIESRYPTIINEKGEKVYSDEDKKLIQSEANSYDKFEEVVLFIGNENILPTLEKTLLLKN